MDKFRLYDLVQFLQNTQGIGQMKERNPLSSHHSANKADGFSLERVLLNIEGLFISLSVDNEDANISAVCGIKRFGGTCTL
jgi:hypothetical protein